MDEESVQIQAAVSQGFTQIAVTWTSISLVLRKTEAFDAELSLQVIEAFEDALDKSAALVRDGLLRQGFTEEMINEQVELVKKLMGFDS